VAALLHYNAAKSALLHAATLPEIKGKGYRFLSWPGSDNTKQGPVVLPCLCVAAMQQYGLDSIATIYDE
jgi:hypothetical protein